MAVTRQHVRIGAANGTGQQSILYGAPVHEKILVIGDTPVEGRQPGNARQADSISLEIHTDTRIHERPIRERGDSLWSGLAPTNRQSPPTIVIEAESDIRPCHRQPPDRVDAGRIFRTMGTEKLAASRHSFKQAFDAHPGSGWKGRRAFLYKFAIIDNSLPTIGAAHAAFNRHARDTRNGWKSLTPKAKSGHGIDSLIRQFRRRMPFKRKLYVVGRHTAAVIGHFDAIDPTADKRYPNLRRTGIDRILHQFFQRRGWSFHHFTGCDAVDEMRGQSAY
jgi:hypothetical protein